LRLLKSNAEPVPFHALQVNTAIGARHPKLQVIKHSKSLCKSAKPGFPECRRAPLFSEVSDYSAALNIQRIQDAELREGSENSSGSR
jgi:hypothetical protein